MGMLSEEEGDANGPGVSVAVRDGFKPPEQVSIPPDYQVWKRPGCIDGNLDGCKSPGICCRGIPAQPYLSLLSDATVSALEMAIRACTGSQGFSAVALSIGRRKGGDPAGHDQLDALVRPALLQGGLGMAGMMDTIRAMMQPGAAAESKRSQEATAAADKAEKVAERMAAQARADAAMAALLEEEEAEKKQKAGSKGDAKPSKASKGKKKAGANPAVRASASEPAAAAAGPSDAAHEDDGLCIVCLDESGEQAFGPLCSHPPCLCSGCAAQLAARGTTQCPLCRAVPHRR
jgi:hypothetical protein